MKSARNTRTGSINVAAVTLVTTRYLNGLHPDTSMASICSVTFMEPSSAPIPEPIFPANIRAVITGPISSITARATIEGTSEEAPNFDKVGIDWRVRVSPIIKPVTATRGKDLYPISYICLRVSLNSYGGLKISLRFLNANIVSSAIFKKNSPKDFGKWILNEAGFFNISADWLSKFCIR